MQQVTKAPTKKQFLKQKTQTLAGLIHQALTGTVVPLKEALKGFPRVTQYKSADTGEIRVGLSLRGINRLVKRHPEITTEQVMEVFNVTPLVDPLVDPLITQGT